MISIDSYIVPYQRCSQQFSAAEDVAWSYIYNLKLSKDKKIVLNSQNPLILKANQYFFGNLLLVIYKENRLFSFDFFKFTTTTNEFFLNV